MAISLKDIFDRLSNIETITSTNKHKVLFENMSYGYNFTTKDDISYDSLNIFGGNMGYILVPLNLLRRNIGKSYYIGYDNAHSADGSAVVSINSENVINVSFRSYGDSTMRGFVMITMSNSNIS